MTKLSTSTEMLNAFELFHYAWKFRSSTLILVLEPTHSLNPLLTDIKLLQKAHIPTLLICTEAAFSPDAFSPEDLERYCERGLELVPFFEKSSQDIPSLDVLADNADKTSTNPSIRKVLEQSKLPILLLSPEEEGQEVSVETLLNYAERASVALQASKTFYFSTNGSLSLNDEKVSYISNTDLDTRLANGEKTNFSAAVLELAQSISRKVNQEFVFLKAEAGSLFTELFTHRGSGTLVSDHFSNIVRSAVSSDVYDILLLMNPAMNDGSVIKYTEEQIASEIDTFSVYSVSGSIVATAKLNDFGEAAEIGKFCTLPKYRGRGRARELATSLIEKAKADGKKSVFGLSTSEEMWSFFKSLGFEEVSRESLADSWKENYDFARPSKAFKRCL